MQTRQGSLEATEAAPASRPEAPKKKVVVRPRKKAPRKSKWNAENILSDPKSPLASADLRSILANPIAWDALDKDEQKEVLSLFPDDQHIVGAGTEDAQPDFVSLMNDDSFRHDCAAYVENIRTGRHDLEWLASAWAAHERRKAGDFDEYLEMKFREDWEVDGPLDMGEAEAAEAAAEAEGKKVREGSVGEEIGVKTMMGDASLDEGQKDEKASEQKDNQKDDQKDTVKVQEDRTGGVQTPKEESRERSGSSEGGEIVEQCIIVQPTKMDVDEDRSEDRSGDPEV